jgi:hypothetical protein
MHFSARNVDHPALLAECIILEMQSTYVTPVGFPQKPHTVHFCAAGRDAVKPALMPVTVQFQYAFPVHTASCSNHCPGHVTHPLT